MADLPLSTTHTWTFYRISGLDQVSLEKGADLLSLKFLDQKLWVALSCPVKGLEIDERTLELIDTDQNGRIRVPELLAAVEWCAARLKNLDDLLAPQPGLPISLVDDRHEAGRTLLSSLRQILLSLGKPEETSITVSEVSDPKKIFANTRFNGDGIVTAASTDDPTHQAAIAEVINLYGAVIDRSGLPGINQEKLDQFLADSAAHEAWKLKGQTPEIRPPGLDLEAAVPAIQAVRGKIEDFFARASLASFDARALSALNRQESDYISVSVKDLTLTGEELSAFPLARVEPNRPLPLNGDVNPAWASRIATLRSAALVPVFGPAQTSLTADEWHRLNALVTPFEEWQKSEPMSPARKLKAERIHEIVTSAIVPQLTALIVQDKTLEPEALAVADVERLARYYRDLGTLLRNFVNFANFYHPQRFSSFQAGTLFFDSRSCDLCVRVEDPATHSILATLSKTYIAYCDLKRGDQTMKIAACFTQGDSDYLMVGRNGLFYDRKGRDWDATITKIIDNPISIAQAFWSPYKKFVRMVEEQIAKRAAAAEKLSDDRLAGAAASTVAADQAKQVEAKKIDVGSVAALGVAVGAIGTAFGYFLGLFKGLLWWEFPLVIVGVMLVISLPSTIIAWLKLRQRTIGPILDATGWAVNGRVKVNIPLGTSLTQRAKLPAGSIHRMDDPFADKTAVRNRRLFFLLMILIVAAYGVFAYRTHQWPFPKPAELQKTPAPEKAPALQNKAAA